MLISYCELRTMPAAPVCRDPPRIRPARNADSLAEHLRDVQAFDVLEANGQARELPGDDGFKIAARHNYTLLFCFMGKEKPRFFTGEHLNCLSSTYGTCALDSDTIHPYLNPTLSLGQKHCVQLNP